RRASAARGHAQDDRRRSRGVARGGDTAGGRRRRREGRVEVTIRVLRRRLAYTGAELRSHFALRRLGIEGDSAVAFVGPCEVGPATMVDLVDLRAGAKICAASMLHVIVETFDADVRRGVLRQRLLAAIARDLLAERAPRASITRAGDDLY